MELFLKTVKGFQLQIILVKDSILDVWQSSKYDFETDMGFSAKPLKTQNKQFEEDGQ